MKGPKKNGTNGRPRPPVNEAWAQIRSRFHAFEQKDFELDRRQRDIDQLQATLNEDRAHHDEVKLALWSTTEGNPGMKHKFESEKYDTKLLECLKEVPGGWTQIVRRGADDKRLAFHVGQLKEWNHSGRSSYLTGGRTPKFTFNGKVILEGQALIDRIRWLKQVPREQQPAPAAAKKGGGKKKGGRGGGGGAGGGKEADGEGRGDVVVAPEDVGVGKQDLDAAMEACGVLGNVRPVQVKGGTDYRGEGGGRIGKVLELAGGDFAVVGGAVRTGERDYTLWPVVREDEWEGPLPETIELRRARLRGAPEVPLAWLLVTDPDGGRWVLGAEGGGFTVRAPHEPIYDLLRPGRHVVTSYDPARPLRIAAVGPTSPPRFNVVNLVLAPAAGGGKQTPLDNVRVEHGGRISAGNDAMLTIIEDDAVARLIAAPAPAAAPRVGHRTFNLGLVGVPTAAAAPAN